MNKIMISIMDDDDNEDGWIFMNFTIKKSAAHRYFLTSIHESSLSYLIILCLFDQVCCAGVMISVARQCPRDLTPYAG